MKRPVLRILFFALIVSGLFVSCKSEFERIRISNDPVKMYHAADEYYENGEYSKAQSLYEIVLSNYRGKKESEDIYFKYAYTHFHLGEYILGSYYFRNFYNTYSTSDKREEALFMAAYCNYELSPKYRLDQKNTRKAIDQFQLFVNTFPRSERVEECNKLIDKLRGKLEKKTFKQGKLYYDLGHYQAAAHSLENLLQEYPDTDREERIRYLIVKSWFEYAQQSIYEQQADRYQRMVEKFREFEEEFSRSEYLKELRPMYEISLNKINSLTYE